MFYICSISLSIMYTRTFVKQHPLIANISKHWLYNHRSCKINGIRQLKGKKRFRRSRQDWSCEFEVWWGHSPVRDGSLQLTNPTTSKILTIWTEIINVEWKQTWGTLQTRLRDNLHPADSLTYGLHNTRMIRILGW